MGSPGGLGITSGETSYHEAVGLDDPDYDKGGRTWYAPLASEEDEADASGRFRR